MDMMSIGFLILMFVLMYFFFVVPQKKHMKERQAMLDAIKAGDKIETVGRVYGKVVSVNAGDTFTVDVGENSSVLIKISKDGVGRVVKDDADKAA